VARHRRAVDGKTAHARASGHGRRVTRAGPEKMRKLPALQGGEGYPYSAAHDFC
jgi:hypothetical protein